MNGSICIVSKFIDIILKNAVERLHLFTSITTPMKTLCLFYFVCFITNKSFAIINLSDTTNPYKLSQQQFLDKYGKDDTASAVINYYFSKHKKAGRAAIICSGIITGSGILYITEVANSAGTSYALGILTIGVMLLFGVSLIGALDNLFNFSRQKLFKTLNNYFSGKGISSGLKKKIFTQNH